MKTFKNIIKYLMSCLDEHHEKVLFLIISIVIYSCLYSNISKKNPDAFNKELDFLDSLYYSSISTLTIGFGDIIPKSAIAKVLTISQGFIFWFLTISSL